MIVLPARAAESDSEADCAVAWAEDRVSLVDVSAAKLHVLQLEPIKIRLGTRWPRLADLVHKLFEKALRRAQGPSDHFVAVGELSYVVTFHGLSVSEASLACTAVAKEVCELLFGDGIDDIAVRALVGTVPKASVFPPVNPETVAAMLERSGTETIVSRLPLPPPVRPPVSDETMIQAHRLMRAYNRTLGCFPVWDLQSGKCSSLFLSPHAGAGNKSSIAVRRFAGGGGENQVVDAEIALLQAAGDYARRLQAAQKICAMGVGVSYETLSGFHSRIRYIGALKKALPANCPFLLKLEQVPDGTLVSRLSELIAMLSQPSLRILIEFSAGGAVPYLDVRLGASGIGVGLPENCSLKQADATAQKLMQRAVLQKSFVFLGGLSSPDLVAMARRQNVRFGIGSALDGELAFTGLESLPDFPLVTRLRG